MIYKHFRGARYEVIGEAQHSETQEVFVIYRNIKDSTKLWIRPKEMFFGDVTLGDGTKVKRFEDESATSFDHLPRC